jgi:hypothetical protein
MLDNAAYHCVHGEGVPKWYKLKKQECIDYLVANAIQFDPAMSATEMKQLVKQYSTLSQILKRAQRHQAIMSFYELLPEPVTLTRDELRREPKRAKLHETGVVPMDFFRDAIENPDAFAEPVGPAVSAPWQRKECSLS